MELSDRPCCRTAVCERRRRPRCLPGDRQRRARSGFRTAWFCFQHRDSAVRAIAVRVAAALVGL